MSSKGEIRILTDNRNTYFIEAKHVSPVVFFLFLYNRIIPSRMFKTCRLCCSFVTVLSKWSYVLILQSVEGEHHEKAVELLKQAHGKI